MKRLLQLMLLLAALLVFWGCNDTQLAQWSSARDQIQRDLAATTQQVAQVQTQVASLPDGPDKERARQVLASAQQLVPVVQAKLDNLDKLIQGATSGNASQFGSGVGGLLTGVPGIGPYAGLIGIVAGLGWGLFQNFQRGKEVSAAQTEAQAAQANLRNVVYSLELAGPDWSEQDKSNIAAIQGPQTSAAVDQIKKDLPL